MVLLCCLVRSSDYVKTSPFCGSCLVYYKYIVDVTPFNPTPQTRNPFLHPKRQWCESLTFARRL